MCSEKWQKIFDSTCNVNHQNIIDRIKEILKVEYQSIYTEWKKKDFDINHLFAFLYEYTNDKCTLLHISAYFGLEDIINVSLAAKDMDVNVKSQGGSTALHLAAKSNYASARSSYIKVVKTLLEKGAKVNTVDQYKHTPLHWAAESGNTDVVRVLLEKGADVNAKNEDGETPLHWAADSDHMEVVKTLLKNGAKADIVDENGETPLHWAIENGYINVVTALLKKGSINVNIKDELEKTPLHWSVLYDQIDIVKVLLDNGAYVNAVDIDGETPLHHAICYYNIEVIKLLLAAGADSTLQNIEGETPIDLAESDEIKDFFKSAEDELNKMKNSNISDTDVSFYEFLQADKVRLKIYARNIHACVGLRKGKYADDYPIYASMIGDQYKIIERKYLEESASIAIGCFGTRVEEGKGKLIYTVISEEICRLIASYLTDVTLCSTRESVIRDKKTRDYIYK